MNQNGSNSKIVFCDQKQQSKLKPSDDFATDGKLEVITTASFDQTPNWAFRWEDLLVTENNYVWFNERRINTKNTHGTGCTLSSSIASFLAKNYSIEEAVSKSKEFVTGAIRDSKKLSVGNGHGPTNHFHALKIF